MASDLLAHGSAGLVAVMMMLGFSGAFAHADALYPDWTGAWRRAVPAQWDPSKPSGLRQQAPLTAEYRAVFEANLATTVSGGQDYNAQTQCIPGGMPRLMIAYGPLEFLVTPEITYVRSDHLNEFRRIYTDWPATLTPTLQGYSIGRWIDADGDSRYDVLTVETRGLRGPRVLDASGIPLHKDNGTVVKERIFLDRADPNMLRDEVTTVDNAFTRPWTVTRSHRRERNPVWIEEPCGEANRYLIIGKETYFMSGDRLLMPTRRDQPPPDLRYFDSSAK